MNTRRRFRSLIRTHEDTVARRNAPTPMANRRKRADKAAGAAWLFADFLAASMSLPADQLADLE